jgi:Sec-independent protein translocase protein TatA
VDAIGDKLLTREFRLRAADGFADAVRRVQQYTSDMKNSAIRRLESEEVVNQENRMCAIEKMLQELADGQEELKAEQMAREADLVKNVGEVFRETLREKGGAQTVTKQPFVTRPNYNRAKPPFHSYGGGRPLKPVNFEPNLNSRGSGNALGPQ